MSKVSSALALAGMLLMGGCTSSPYRSVDTPARLEVVFADAAWDGKTVPAGQRCRWAGGNGATPPLRVTHIPAGANALLVEFSDRSYVLMDHGGHGVIGLWLARAVQRQHPLGGGRERRAAGADVRRASPPGLAAR